MVIQVVTMNIIEYNTAVKSSNFKIMYGFHTTPIGKCLIGITNNQNAICHLWFFDNDSPDDCFKIMIREWPGAEFIEETRVTYNSINAIFMDNTKNNDLVILLKGTEFQMHVWKMLLTIPRGKTVSYSDVAKSIGNSKAVRAVASTIAKNRIGYLVPCHRVLPKNGSDFKFRWGNEKRFTMLNFDKI